MLLSIPEDQDLGKMMKDFISVLPPLDSLYLSPARRFKKCFGDNEMIWEHKVELDSYGPYVPSILNLKLPFTYRNHFIARQPSYIVINVDHYYSPLLLDR